MMNFSKGCIEFSRDFSCFATNGKRYGFPKNHPQKVSNIVVRLKGVDFTYQHDQDGELTFKDVDSTGLEIYRTI